MAASASKAEVARAAAAIKKIVDARGQDGVSQKDIQSQVDLSGQLLQDAINHLLRSADIDAFQTIAGLYFRPAAEESKQLVGLNKDERLVHQLIQEHGNKGIWTRELRRRSQLDEKTLNKALRKLESNGVIKKVKTVMAAKKNIWMLAHLEPDRKLTGGAWYSEDQEFEAEFVAILCKLTLQFLREKATRAQRRARSPLELYELSCVRASEVAEHVEKTKFSKVVLKESDIVSVLETLVWDGEAERCSTTEQQLLGSLALGDDSSQLINTSPMYKVAMLDVRGSREGRNTVAREAAAAAATAVPAAAAAAAAAAAGGGSDAQPMEGVLSMQPGGAAVLATPCGVCPVADNCFEGGVVSPSNCVYIKDWLNAF